MSKGVCMNFFQCAILTLIILLFNTALSCNLYHYEDNRYHKKNSQNTSSDDYLRKSRLKYNVVNKSGNNTLALFNDGKESLDSGAYVNAINCFLKFLSNNEYDKNDLINVISFKKDTEKTETVTKNYDVFLNELFKKSSVTPKEMLNNMYMALYAVFILIDNNALGIDKKTNPLALSIRTFVEKNKDCICSWFTMSQENYFETVDNNSEDWQVSYFKAVF